MGLGDDAEGPDYATWGGDSADRPPLPSEAELEKRAARHKLSLTQRSRWWTEWLLETRNSLSAFDTRLADLPAEQLR